MDVDDLNADEWVPGLTAIADAVRRIADALELPPDGEPEPDDL